jgi:hypothetical protein
VKERRRMQWINVSIDCIVRDQDRSSAPDKFVRCDAQLPHSRSTQHCHCELTEPYEPKRRGMRMPRGLHRGQENASSDRQPRGINDKNEANWVLYSKLSLLFRWQLQISGSKNTQNHRRSSSLQVNQLDYGNRNF